MASTLSRDERIAEIDALLSRLVPELSSLGFHEPHAGQLEVLGSALRYNVMKCGRRFGKTDMLERMAVETARGGYPAAYFAPSYPMLAEFFRELCLKVVKWKGVRPIISEHRVEFPTGGSIDCWSLGDEANRARGRKYARVCLDECALVDSLSVAWEESIAPTLMDLAGDAWFGSTPKLGSVFDEFYERGQRGDAGWASWELPTHKNPFITASEIEERRANMTEAAFNREILAKSEEAGSDLMHPGFGKRHIGVAKAAWEECRWRVLGFDPGGGDPTAIVPIGVDRMGWFHQYGEFWRERNAGSVSLPTVIEEVERWNKRGKLDAIVVDKTAKGWVQGLLQYGYPAVESISARSEGFEVIDWLLEGEPPRLTIDPSCVRSIEEFREYRKEMRKDRVSGISYATKNAHWTHSDCMDARRYACVWIVRNLRGKAVNRKVRYTKPRGYRPMGVLS